MDLTQLARYLQRDPRELSKLANRGHLPGQKVGGEWRFARVEINYWVESQLPHYTDLELTAFERSQSAAVDQPLVAKFLSQSTIAWPLAAATRASVYKELVTLAEQSWQVYDPDALLQAVRQREERSSTALEGGVALLHPRSTLPNTVLGDSVISLGYVPAGLPFGAPGGGSTDLFFLIACSEYGAHLRVLTRLSRMFLVSGFLDRLRSVDTAGDAYRVIEDAERELVPSV